MRRHRSGDFVLNVEHVLQFPVVALVPELCAVLARISASSCEGGCRLCARCLRKCRDIQLLCNRRNVVGCALKENEEVRAMTRSPGSSRADRGAPRQGRRRSIPDPCFRSCRQTEHRHRSQRRCEGDGPRRPRCSARMRRSTPTSDDDRHDRHGDEPDHCGVSAQKLADSMCDGGQAAPGPVRGASSAAGPRPCLRHCRSVPRAPWPTP